MQNSNSVWESLKAFMWGWVRSYSESRAAVFILMGGCVLSIIAAVGFRQFENREFQATVQLGAERRVRAIRRQVEEDLTALSALSGFMEVQHPFTSSDFHVFANRLLASHPSLLAVEWVARVGGDERKRFEEELSRTSGVDLRITEGLPGSGRQAAERSEYYPVRYLAPLTPANRSALGYDLWSCGRCRKALEAAAMSGRPATMDRLSTLEREGFAVGIVLPAVAKGREAPEYAMILLHIGGVVETALQPLERQGINIVIFDESAPAASRFLYAHRWRRDPVNDGLRPELHFADTISVGDRTWRVVCTPTAELVAASTTWWPWVLFFGGIVCTFSVSGYFRSKAVHAHQSAKLVNSLTEQTERLRESEARMQQIFATVLDAIITTDERGIITDWNPRAEVIFGWRANEAIGKPLIELLPPKVRPEYEAGFEGNRSLELTALHRDGTEFPVEWTVAPVVIGGAPHFNSFVRDITERKKLEAQLLQSQKMESIGQLAGGIAHDFNNLLTVISGAAQLGEMHLHSGGSALNDLAAIRSAADKAAALTQQILAYSRKQSLQPTKVNLNALVSGLMGMIRRLIGVNIKITLDMQENLWDVTVDAGQFEQVILNMVINSRDAMPEGGRLSIRTRNIAGDEAGNARVLLAITDTGIGMSPETQQNIFDPFFTTKGVGKGSGLGLSMAHGVVHQSNGEIRVESAVGQGTTFTIVLPRVDDERPSGAMERAEAKVMRGHENILVVEDEDLVRGLVQSALEAVGYRVSVASSGREALAYLSGQAGQNIQLVLSDLMMPEMNGRELAQRIRADRPETKILFTSGYSDDSVGFPAGMENGSAFIQKPYSLGDLASKVRQLLDS